MYEIITLPNGVRIAHEKMSGVRSAAVGIWVGVGSRYEKRGEEGSAHFIEHMLFKGTAHSTAAELAGRMDAIGGQVNAFTSRDSTCFYARVLDSHLDEASDILCEMFFDSLFSESDVVNEPSEEIVPEKRREQHGERGKTAEAVEQRARYCKKNVLRPASRHEPVKKKRRGEKEKQKSRRIERHSRSLPSFGRYV